MIKISRLAALAGLALVWGRPVSAATTFDFLFDNSGGGPDGTIGTPLVGSGTFISPVDLGAGQYALSSLPGFSLQFIFGAQTFTASYIATPVNEIAVAITQLGFQQRLVFTENGSPGDGGPFHGSLDLINAQNDYLSFEPTSSGGQNLYFESGFNIASGSNFYEGNYLALSPIPEPASLAVFGGGLASIGAIRRKRSVAAACKP